MQTPVVVRPVARIHVSPHLMKTLLRSMADAIRNYEAAWNITLPEMLDAAPQATANKSAETADQGTNT
jgi:hypothetical protein